MSNAIAKLPVRLAPFDFKRMACGGFKAIVDV